MRAANDASCKKTGKDVTISELAMEMGVDDFEWSVTAHGKAGACALADKWMDSMERNKPLEEERQRP